MIVCVCHNVNEKTIFNALAKLNGLDSVEEKIDTIKQDTKACSNCGKCAGQLRQLIEKTPG